MCKRVPCPSCKGQTWWGCGKHVPSVMDSIPADKWCTCDPKVEREGHTYPPMQTNTS
ncbi:hypothetical protein K491DRAFT_692374 [Lophiostoma macrostomum CBS 122681]|uniref:Uncharacterized protein n=1 Tax=Lophiostoma macrostomum CBS 122681 TaxID=1314788 RepID=A0A6A6TBN5_9PLEO|nr:hypothetical protein K491DRAFT_692374 [Lophiostoma macrostomum CBS 122681]